MTVNVLKVIADAIVAPLAGVVNFCLANGVFPEPLKISRTVPVFKKGDPTLMASYRPISIIPVFAKVFETVMKVHLCNYLEKNNIFSCSQHGFRPNLSTVTAVANLTENVLNPFEDGESTALILADLSKAFDTVNHELLIKKLSRFGVSGPVLNTFKCYLQDRKQVLSISGAKSELLTVKYGVPQGSVVGPVLFLTMINDLDLVGEVLLFADDTTILARGSTPDSARINAAETFESAKLWFSANKLNINERKTQKMTCSLTRSVNPLDEEDAVKLLGIIIDSKLSWNNHVDRVCVKLSRVTYLLRRLKSLLTVQHLVSVYHALFHSHISYGLLIWGNGAGCDKVLRLQKKALRLITSAGRMDSCRPIFVQLGILTIYSQYIFQCLVYAKTNINSFATRSVLHSHHTRSSNLLDVPYCRLGKKKNSFSVLAIKLFNALPAELKSIELLKFKKDIKRLLTLRPLYSVQEYFDSLLSWSVAK